MPLPWDANNLTLTLAGLRAAKVAGGASRCVWRRLLIWSRAHISGDEV